MNKPAYAYYDSAQKFLTIQGIIIEHLTRHPKAICSYSGGSDSDTMIDLIERTRADFWNLPKVKYVFFDTGLEMEATKRHVKEVSEKYGIEIETIRPKKNIVLSTREHGLPFMSKLFSEHVGRLQKHGFDFSDFSKFKNGKITIKELIDKYPNTKSALTHLFGYRADLTKIEDCQSPIFTYDFFADFLSENPPKFLISAKCCDDCKKSIAKKVQKGYDLIISGERASEGGVRVLTAYGSGCFSELSNGQYRFKPLYYLSGGDKAWYKERYGLRYSDAYEVYGLKRTGCGGCSIAARALEEIAIIGKYEPNLAKAIWAVFGDAYRYRQQYIEYRDRRRWEEKEERECVLNAWKPYLNMSYDQTFHS